MKKFTFLFILFMCISSGIAINAQDDDVYFVPSKSKENNSIQQSSYSKINSDYHSSEDYDGSNWAEGRGYGGRDIDEYNRRNFAEDTLAADSSQYYSSDDYDGAYTQRLIRFHSPTVGIYVSSPYYWDFCDFYWNDPWFYNRWYWGGWGFGPYYWNSWWGWSNPWFYDYAWGWYPHWGGWYPGGWQVLPSNARRGPVGGYVTYGNRGILNGSRTFRNQGGGNYAVSGNGSSYRPSRNFGGNRYSSGTTYRPSRSYGNSVSRPSRSWNVQPNNSSNTYRPSNNTPSRSFGSPSRSFEGSSGSTFSRPSGGNLGGGRSFGGGNGGGRSFGGRR